MTKAGKVKSVENNQTIFSLLQSLWQHISRRRRMQLSFLLIIIVVTSFTEILSIGAVLPFLTALTAPERIFENINLQPVIAALGIKSPGQILLPFAIIFGISALIAGAMRLILLWVSNRLSYSTGADISINIYRRTLYQSYAVHCSRNTSEIINGILNKTDNAILSINLVLTFISSSVMLIAILIVLFIVNPLVAIIAFGGFGLIYIFIIYLIRNKLLTNSRLISLESSYVIKSLQEGLGGIRDVLIDGTQATYCKVYHNADVALRRAQGNNLFIATSPRFIMESLGMILITGLAYSLALQSEGYSKAIPTLGAMALAAQRLLPVLQQTYQSWSGIHSGQISLRDTVELLDQPLPRYADQLIIKPLPFESKISLRSLGFRFNPDAPYIFKNLNLDIRKGSRLGIIGSSASGKSTLLDIIMGLLQPSHGKLVIDNKVISLNNQRNWQSHIAHVPQSIFLADTTIEENIAFGVAREDIDIQLVKKSAQQAQIADDIENLPKQYKSLVGERGIRLSGGQRQRIGIARALYKQAKVIIFDEATSALDNKTEKTVMQAIENLSKDLTLIIVAHRLSTLKNCTQIVEIGDLGIKRIGSYQNIVNYAKASD